MESFFYICENMTSSSSSRGIRDNNKEPCHKHVVCVCLCVCVFLSILAWAGSCAEAVFLRFHQVTLRFLKKMCWGHCTAEKRLVFVLISPLVVFSFMLFVTELVFSSLQLWVLGIPQECRGTNSVSGRKLGAGRAFIKIYLTSSLKLHAEMF